MSMSDDQESRTEQASGRRLEKAREEGDIAVGRDTAIFASLAAGAAALLSAAPLLRDGLVNLVEASLRHMGRTSEASQLLPFLSRPVGIALGACAAGTAAVIVALGIQTRGGFWAQHALPQFDKVFGGGRLKRMFGGEMFADMGLAVVKTVTIGWVLWTVFRDAFMTLPRMLTMGPSAQLAGLYAPIADGAVKILTAIAFVAGLDLAVTRLRYRKRMMMSKEDAKREYKEEEGDPMFRARRKRRHRDIIKGQINLEVPRADVLVVNPTHIAIALRYRAGEDKAPRVTAKGKGKIAEVMRDLARQHGIPIVEDIPLARLLYKRVKVGKYVPMETYKAVAAVLAFVYRVLGRSPAMGGATIR